MYVPLLFLMDADSLKILAETTLLVADAIRR